MKYFIKRHKTKILVSLFFIALGVLIFWIYPIVKLHYSMQSLIRYNSINISPKTTTDKNNSILNQETNNHETSNPSDKNDDDEQTEKTKNEVRNDNNAGEFIDITSEDCDENCEQFENEEDIKYCREVCGLEVTDENSQNNKCDDLQNLEKDYCWKNEAVANQDFEICRKIKDKKIKETCENRITEDLLEK